MTIVPKSRPQQSLTTSLRVLRKNLVTDSVAILAIRGYYRDTMGLPGQNDRGIYDDAIMLVSPTFYATFNANTDPSVTRKHIATLKAGVWRYKIGTHGLSKPVARRYKALVQAAVVTVARDGEPDETGMLGINIHKGSFNSTSSLGCLTVFPTQWAAFIASVESELQRYGQKTIPLCLVNV